MASIASLAAVALAPAAASAAVTVSGIALEEIDNSNGTEWTGCDGTTANVTLVLDAGAWQASTTCNASSGAYSFAGVPLTASHTITVYLNPTVAGDQGVTYTRNADTVTNIANLLVSEDWIRIRHEGAGPLSIANVNAWDNGNDADIPAVSDGVTMQSTVSQTIGLLVDSGKSFTPGGGVTVAKLRLEGSYDAGATTLVLTGSGTNSCTSATDSASSIRPLCFDGGTFTAGTGLVRFTGTGTLDVPSATLNLVELVPASGSPTYDFPRTGSTITAAQVLVGDGLNALKADVQGTLNVTSGAGTIWVSAAATVRGDGIIETRGDFTGAGAVDEGADTLAVRIRPAGGGVVLYGSTSGSSIWNVGAFQAGNSGAVPVTIQLAAGGTGIVDMDSATVGPAADLASTTFDNDTNDRNLDIDGNLLVDSRGTFHSSSVQPLFVFGSVTVNGQYFTNGGALTVEDDNNLTVGSAGTFTGATANVVVQPDGDVSISGTYTSTSGMLTVQGKGNMTVNGTGTYTTATGNLTIGGNVTVNLGGNLNVNAVVVDIGGNLAISGTYTVTGAGVLHLDGNFTKSGGTFNGSTGSVLFEGTEPSFLTQTTATTFYNLSNVTPNKVLRIANTQSVTVSGTLTVAGSSCNGRAGIASQVDGTPFSISAAATSFNFADIGDANNTGAVITASNSHDGGGNTGWNFTTPCALVTVTGFAYQDEAGTPWSQCGATANVGLSVAGFRRQPTTCNPVDGSFSFIASSEPDQAIVVFLDPASVGDKGVTYSRGPAAGSNTTGLQIVKGQVRVRSDSSVADTMTNVIIADYDKTFDADIPIDATSPAGTATVDAGYEVLIEVGERFDPGGDVIAPAVDVAGTLGSLGSNRFTVNGSGTTPTCTAAVGTSTPLCVRAGGTIAMAAGDTFRYAGTAATYIWATTYPNLDLNATGGSPTYAIGTSAGANAITVNGQLDIGSGAAMTVTTSTFNGTFATNDLDVGTNSTLSGSGNGTLLVNDQVDGNGTINLTAGQFHVRGLSANSPDWAPTIMGSWTFYDLLFSTASATPQTITAYHNGTFRVTNLWTVGQGTDAATTTFNANSNDPSIDVDGDVLITSRGGLTASNTGSFTIGGSFTNNGTFTHSSGTVTFDDAARASSLLSAAGTTFHHLTIATASKTLRFQQGQTTTVAGTLTATGGSCTTPVTLESASAGTQWTVNAAVVNTMFVRLRDSVAAPARTAGGSGDLGGNSGWTFLGACAAPATMFAHDSDASTGVANNVSIGAPAPHFSWLNQSGLDTDAQEAEFVSTPLDGVVSLWHMDTATGITTDSSTAPHALTMFNAPTSPASQAGFSQALGLDGVNRYATATDATAYDLSTAFTVETWFRTANVTGTKVLVDKSSGGDYNFQLAFTGGLLQAMTTRNSSGVEYMTSTSSVGLDDNAWHHVAMVVDGGNMLRLYLDGAPVGTPASVGGAISMAAGTVYIGRLSSGGSYFAGELDDVRISSVVRSAPEILGYVRTLLPHFATVWSSPTLAIANCAAGARCADVAYAGPMIVKAGARYHVRARQRTVTASMWTLWAGWDWFETQPSLSLSIPTGTSVPLSPGTLPAGTSGTATSDIEVTSTSATGYSLTAKDTSDTAALVADVGSATWPDWTDKVAPGPWPAGTSGYFGITVLSATGGKDTARWGIGTTATDFTDLRYLGLDMSTPATIFHRSSYAAGTDTIVVGYRGSPSASQAAGGYTGTITYTLTASP